MLPWYSFPYCSLWASEKPLISNKIIACILSIS
nr:MAG TPA: hypothetical protein [Caudoviricetes sp.]